MEITMLEVDGGILVGKALKNEGIEVIFTLSGSLNTIYNACVDEGISLIDMRHEQAVANAATGYAIATRKPSIALVTEGPGVVNMASGIATAWYACAPVIGISTHAPYQYEGMGAISEFDSQAMYRRITKWIAYCTQTKRIPEYIATGFRYATTGRKGPILLDFPVDTLKLKVEEKEVSIIQSSRYRTNARPYGDPILVKKAVEWLLDADRPGILIGSGVLWSEASEELIKFAEFMKIPVCYAIGGKGCIPDDHPLCGGPVGYDFGSISGADVLLAIGVRFEEILNFGKGDFYADDIKIISVDIEPTEIGRNRPVDLGIWGDAKAVLTQLLEASKNILKKKRKKREETEWLKDVQFTLKSMNEILYSGASSSKKPIDPRRLGKEVCEFLDRESYIIMDGGNIQAHITPLFCARFPGSYMSALGGSLGHLGGGVPFAIGVKTARPDKKVLVIEGDGSFLFNASEIDTAVRHDKQIVIVIGNNSQWGMVRHAQQLTKAYDVCSRLNDTVRYDKFSESLGGYGELITEPDEIKPALKRAFDSGLPAVLDVRTDPSIMTFADYHSVETD
jgi:acetolactate synthase-1/2/3 large subunit